MGRLHELQLQVPIRNLTACEHSAEHELTANMMCAGYPEGVVVSCGADIEGTSDSAVWACLVSSGRGHRWENLRLPWKVWLLDQSSQLLPLDHGNYQRLGGTTLGR